MKKGDLPGYDPDHPVPDDVRAVYGIVLPLFVEYVLDELIEKHGRDGHEQAAREDALRRVHELMDEARWNRAIGRPESIGTWYTAKRWFSFAKPDADLRKRRRKLPANPKLLDEFGVARSDLYSLLPRRPKDVPTPGHLFKLITSWFPELGWFEPQDSLGVTPTQAARIVLARRYGVSANHVKKAIERARR